MYSLNTQLAREADTQSSYLNETGKYIGVFTRAERIVSRKKTEGIGFTFADASKRSTKFDLWLKNAYGEGLPALKTLNAILVCLKIKNIQPVPGKVERYDFDTKEKKIVDAEVFPDLVKKPIGLLLQKTEYEKIRDVDRKVIATRALTGETGWRLELLMPFEAESELTASEILDRKTQPERLPRVIASLADKPLKNKSAQKPAASSANTTNSENLDEDIPF